ncbi:MAG TPA: YgiQ family radical SAM protein [Pirellulaceae bacterium]|nr:YgiQ family radical SAM protein [Pirellulaceae bacterium]HMO93475.1 YgiQ family radical SAM protein [Pirellulaceae bacterium]HMP69210.1 YgiQ family radical SAM protein [Pirellulaceae bacterium]
MQLPIISEAKRACGRLEQLIPAEELAARIPLPMTMDEARARGWEELDVVFVTGDAYIDHPSFAMAILGRTLEAAGYRVGIVSQPDWTSCRDWQRFGRPRLFFAISAGNMDSMINHYTANRKVRNSDAYSPGGRIGLRPDRATLAYCQRAREAFKGVPVIAGGVEASLRRLAHYDYWSDKVRKSILLDSKADLLVFGMGENPIIEIADRLKARESVKQLRDMRGVAYRLGKSESPPEDAILLPSFEEVRTCKFAFADATKMIHNETNPYNARRLKQAHGDEWVIVNPPQFPISKTSMDRIYDLPYTRRAHPSYREPIPAFQIIKDSVTIMRGCFGGCTFCSITAHQGRVIQSRSQSSIINEISQLAAEKDFKGVISDIGGPTANMYEMKCSRPEVEAKCRRQSCVHPTICKLLCTNHGPIIQLMRKSREVKGVKKVLVASGIRMDLAQRSPEYMAELTQHHVGGLLKVAPEHADTDVLDKMKKPSIDNFRQFARKFERESQKANKKQHLVPYFIASHPGSDLNSMIQLAVFLKQNGYKPDQVQDFIPAPLDVATCMYYTGMDPFTKKPVYIARTLRDRKMQRALMQFFKPENYFEVRKALIESGRRDLIGNGCDCLIPEQPPREAIIHRRKQSNQQFRGDYVHQINKQSKDLNSLGNKGRQANKLENPESVNQAESASGKRAKRTKSSKKQSRFAPSSGYRPDRKGIRRRDNN